jgi:uncharacterized DUF497 family protein
MKRLVSLCAITTEEAEDVFFSNPLEFPGREISGEERRLIVGATKGGRILNVVWTIRDGLIRVVTAYEAKGKYRRAFLEGE